MKKTIATISIAALVALGGYFILTLNQQEAQPSSAIQPTVVEEKLVTYTDSGYSPNSITIKKGETVIFKNQSARSMWTASGAHPTHRLYPTTGGCLGSTFDACQGVQPDDSWSFTFDIVGAWKYHNHLRPEDTGTIIVE